MKSTYTDLTGNITDEQNSIYSKASTATDIVTVSNALREGSTEIKSFGFSYGETKGDNSEIFITRIDKFIDAINRAWSVIKTNLRRQNPKDN